MPPTHEETMKGLMKKTAQAVPCPWSLSGAMILPGRSVDFSVPFCPCPLSHALFPHVPCKPFVDTITCYLPAGSGGLLGWPINVPAWCEPTCHQGHKPLFWHLGSLSISGMWGGGRGASLGITVSDHLLLFSPDNRVFSDVLSFINEKTLE